MFSHFSISHFNARNTTNGGFGLIELLVSISIMVVVVSIVLVQQSSFNGAVLLRSQAYEVALQLRDVQLNAVSASSDPGSFRAVIGVHFDDSNATDNTYRVYRDSDSPNDYFYSADEEFGQQGFLDERFEIRDIRAIGDTYDDNGLSVVFERPNFDARFYDSSGQVNASSVEIDVARRDVTGSGVDVVRTVEVTSAGQISVQ